jgi:DNA polymerase-3 subunit epsilon
VLDTARLSRAILGRGEVPNHKLATLAQHFRATTRPVHRALDDARATVDVLHGLMERIGSLGMTDLEDLLGYSGRVAESQRRKRHLADGLPHAPGVYLFADERGETLYVGTSKDIRGRVRTYFTASEQRTRMAEMVALAARVTPIVCASPLEAAVRELRLIAERKPRYNRRSRFPERGRWLKLTVEAAPRLSLVAAPRADLDTGAAYLGPLSSRTADDIKEVLQLATSIRTCTERLSPARPRTPCSLAELGRCCAPCTGPVAMDLYRGAAEAARRALRDDAAGVAESVMDRIRSLGAEQRYEEAGALLGKLRTFLRHADRTQQRQALADAGQIVAAEPEGGSWIIHVIRHGRLAGAVRSPVGADPRPAAHAAVATAEQVAPPTGPGAASLAEEADLILTWLARPGVRVIGVSGSWTLPLRAAARYRATLEEPPRVGSASGAPAGDSPDIAGSADSCGDLHPAGEDIARTA